MKNWKQAVTVATVAPNAAPVLNLSPVLEIAQQLRAAAGLFAARTDSFAIGKAATCRDIAEKLERFGSFASDAQESFARKLIEWAKPRAAKPVAADVAQTVSLLERAAAVYARRNQTGKSDTCLDIAAKLERFGSFASPAQEGFARSLIAVADVDGTSPSLREERAVAAPSAAPAGLAVPKLFDVMQRHAHLHMGDLKISRQNQNTLCWLVWQGTVSGKIEGGIATLWKGKLGDDLATVTALLVEIEADPLAAAVKFGRLSGRCCSCGRDLTDEGSIAAGIGPICAQRFQ